MKTINNVTLYQCEHCKKKLFMKHAMVKHEKYCESNPKNDKACSICIHLERTEIEWESLTADDWGHRHIVKSKGFKCTKLDKLVYPTKAERLGLPEKYPETFENQEPMPKNCSQMNVGILF